MKRDGIIFILSSPSGGGKTTLSRMVREKVTGLTNSVSYTTRPKRAGEKDGTDYHFLGEKEFKDKLIKGYFAEWATVHNHLYGTSREDLQAIIDNGKDAIMDIDVQGARQMKEAFQEAVTVFILPPSIQELTDRLRGRATEDEAEIQKRIKAAMGEMAAFSFYDYLIVNRDLSGSVEQMKAIIAAERLRASRFRDDPDLNDLIAGRDKGSD
jgi:guanylate kinase